MPRRADKLQLETLPPFEPLLIPARYKGAHGGRGSGKSHFFAEELILKAAFAPIRAVCIREIQRTLDQSVKRLLEDKIQKHQLGEYFKVLDNRIVGRCGSLIIFQGMQNHTADSIKSLEGYDIAWVEEAQSLSQRSLDLLRPTIRKEGSEIWFSWNRRFETDPVDVFLTGEDGPPPGSVVIKVNYDGNKWFPDVLRAEMEWDLGRDPDKYAHIWLGEYLKNTKSRVFNNWRVAEFPTPDDVRLHYGADWGYSVDPSTLTRCWFEGRTLYIDYEAYRVGCETDYIPALFAGDCPEGTPPAQQWDNPHRFEGVPGARDWPIIADSARPETINHVRRRGFSIHPARKGAGSVEDGIEWLKSFDIVVHPRCQHTIDELSTYSWKVDPITDAVLPQLVDKDNHVIDPLRYATEGIRRGRREF